jgi:hypothetical protein
LFPQGWPFFHEKTQQVRISDPNHPKEKSLPLIFREIEWTNVKGKDLNESAESWKKLLDTEVSLGATSLVHFCKVCGKTMLNLSKKYSKTFNKRDVNLRSGICHLDPKL